MGRLFYHGCTFLKALLGVCNDYAVEVFKGVVFCSVEVLASSDWLEVRLAKWLVSIAGWRALLCDFEGWVERFL